MIDHHPVKPGPGDRRKFVFKNMNKYDVRIQYFHFESSRYPRHWDTTDDNIYVPRDNGIHSIPIVGPGRIFMKWHEGSLLLPRADSFEVSFDPAGEPYPYIFGGDRWTMALRHAALRANDGND